MALILNEHTEEQPLKTLLKSGRIPILFLLISKFTLTNTDKEVWCSGRSRASSWDIHLDIFPFTRCYLVMG